MYRYYYLYKLLLQSYMYVYTERVSATESRFVAVTFQTAFRRITVQSLSGSLLRIVDLQNLADIAIRHLSDNRHIVLRVKHHYDLVSCEYIGKHLLSTLKFRH